jgi:hypothetical protein
MKPWLRIYRNEPDWREIEQAHALEIRFGAFGFQAGIILPRFGFAIWRNKTYAPLVLFHWQPAAGH